VNRVGRGAAADSTVRRRRALAGWLVALVGTLAGCSSQADLGGEAQPVGGQLRGLTPGETVTLQDNLGDHLTLSSNGAFTFPTAVASGATYSVTVLNAPSSPIAQTCSVSNARGMVGAAPVASVTVDCDLQAYFPFQGNASDASGYGHDAVVVDASLAADRNGSTNSAYSFAGIGSIQAAMPTGFLPSGSDARTLTAWIEPAQSTSLAGFIYWGAGNCTGQVFGVGDMTDQANFWGGCNDYTSGLMLPVGSWSFVALVYSPAIPTQITLYVGDRALTGTILAPTTPNMGSLVIGSDLVNGMSFTGNIDSVRIYGRALNPAEVHSIFTSQEP
jgi:Concanavalin A-like lectin/glucanases superfamily